ncbi:MAG: hypothetical protein AVDCRST_MAG89-767, partial [uncultured Gemmatimonadetes bacterium]
ADHRTHVAGPVGRGSSRGARGQRPALHGAARRRVPVPARHHGPSVRGRGVHRRARRHHRHLAGDGLQGARNAGQLQSGGQADVRRRLRALRRAHRRPLSLPLPRLRAGARRARRASRDAAPHRRRGGVPGPRIPRGGRGTVPGLRL